jgi:diadenylate cyclase
LEFLRDMLAQSWLGLLRTVADLALVYFIVYRALLLIRGTRAVQVLIGLLAIIIFSFATKEEHLNLPTLHWLLETFLGSFILIIIVLFQEDIRRGLSQMGRTSLFPDAAREVDTHVIEELVRAAVALSQQGHGALVAVEREADLRALTESGVPMSAQVTQELLCALFVPDAGNPLHDGAVILKDDKIAAAACFLPLTNNPNVDKHLGTRHRAAIGLSESTDAVILVVSEETGMISVAWREELVRGLDSTSLRELLYRLFRTKGPLEHQDGTMLSWLRAQQGQDAKPDAPKAPASAKPPTGGRA